MFSTSQEFCVIDYETFSEADIKKCGSYEYTMHPSTEVLCLSGKVGTVETLRKTPLKRWAPKREWNAHRDDMRSSLWLREAILNPKVILVAHNALFEKAVTRNVLVKHLKKYFKGPIVIPHERFLCTAVLSSICALPRKLEGVTEALNLKHKKDAEGHRLMLRWSKPKKPSKKDPSTRYVNNFDRLVQYCDHDIHAEVELLIYFLTKFWPLTQRERELWCFDQEINFRGVQVDRDLVQKILHLIKQDKERMTKELRKLTGDYVQTGGQRDQLLRWLKKEGVVLPNLKAKTVEDAIKDGSVVGKAKRVLELRQMLNKTSLKKYTAFLHQTASDSRMRFSLNFHAASTGRWGGAGVQPQNFPRGTLKYKDEAGVEHDLAPFACELIKSGVTLDFLASQFGDPVEVFVSCLRGMITASPGKELFVDDFAAIEARVLFWLADHVEGCKAFAEGRKMYEELAMVIFGVKDIMKITKDQRFVGKEAFLGSGFGMGWPKFQSTCADKGRIVDAPTSKKAIKAYREENAPVPKLWNNLEQAAINAVENPGKTYKVNHTEWFVKGRFLCCRLPSGRCLYYYGAFTKYERTPWGTSKAVLYHWGVNSRTKKWEVQKTWGGTLTENVVQATARDLMSAAMRRIQNKNYDIILTVHDEIIGERDIGEGSVEGFNRLMRTLPKWARKGHPGVKVDCPVNVEGWKGQRYRK